MEVVWKNIRAGDTLRVITDAHVWRDPEFQPDLGDVVYTSRGFIRCDQVVSHEPKPPEPLVEVERRLLEKAARSAERLIGYAASCGTVDSDNRDEARQCLAEIRAALGRRGSDR